VTAPGAYWRVRLTRPQGRAPSRAPLGPARLTQALWHALPWPGLAGAAVMTCACFWGRSRGRRVATRAAGVTGCTTGGRQVVGQQSSAHSLSVIQAIRLRTAPARW
jgi:hypothetical protein